ncbi:MAG: competence protein ComEC [Chloroflexota bacterium]|jgi:competence protein ComEC|nr:competence protein ComEC [Chloroflexota bacterium]
MAAVLTAWCAGIMAAVLLSPLLPWLVLAAVLMAVVALINQRLALLAALCFVAALTGAARAATVATVELPPGLAGQAIAVSGSVDDDPVDRRGMRRLTVRLDHLLTSAGEIASGLRIQVAVYGTTPVHYGDLVLLSGELQAPPRFDQFDYRAFLAEQGIAAVMPSARLVRVTSHPGDPLHTMLFDLRHGVIDAVDRALPEPQAALLLGVVFGYRAALPRQLEQQMIASGLIHIVVISGLKVSLLARIVQQAFGRLAPRAAPLIAVGAMIGYALLAGASAAALRAAAMGVLVVIAGRLRRDSQVFVSLALTGALMLGLKPGLSHDVSFQLSFAGTAGIAAMTDGIAKRLGWMPTILRDPFAATIAAEAATWPLMLANFHQLSIVAPAANALVLPLLPAIMILGGSGALLAGGLAAAGLPMLQSLSSILGWPLMQASGAIASWFRLVVETAGSLPLAAVVAPYFPPRWLAAAAVLNGGALAGVKLRQFFWQRKVWALLAASGLIAVALLLIRPDGRVHVYALDVGTGSAVLIRTPNGHQVLIDAGPDADRFAQAIGQVLPPTARKIDVWLVTGGRREDIGGAGAVLNRFAIGSMVIADPDPWSVTLRMLVQHAQSANVQVDSANGMIELDGVSLNLAGDGRTWLIQSGLERIAVVPPQTNWQSLPADIDVAIFTCGGPAEWQGPGRGVSVMQVAANSRAGLPVRGVLQALTGAPLYRTDRVGTVELVQTEGGFSSPR